MSRPLRIEYEGAWYHIMNRGLAHNSIFMMDKHYKIFLDLLLEIHERYQAEIHAYCLMENHYHLIIHTPLGNIGRIMRHLDGIYTQKFNYLVNRDGPLFRGRYKSILIEEDVYLLKLSRYIHLNPVKAQIVKKPEDFQWSSYNAYFSHKKPYWLTTKHILNYFDNNHDKMKMFTEEEIDNEIDELFSKKMNIPVLGTKKFTQIITDKYLKKEHKIDDIPEHKIVIKNCKPTIEKIISSVADFYRRPMIEDDNSRSVAMYLAYTIGQYTCSQIAYFFHITSAGVSKACHRFQKRIKNNDLLKKEIGEIMKSLSNFQT